MRPDAVNPKIEKAIKIATQKLSAALGFIKELKAVLGSKDKTKKNSYKKKLGDLVEEYDREIFLTIHGEARSIKKPNDPSIWEKIKGSISSEKQLAYLGIAPEEKPAAQAAPAVKPAAVTKQEEGTPEKAEEPAKPSKAPASTKTKTEDEGEAKEKTEEVKAPTTPLPSIFEIDRLWQEIQDAVKKFDAVKVKKS